MHASFYRTSLYCTLQMLCSFTGWSSVATLWSSKSKGTIFPRALANFKSLSHFGNSGNISNFLMTIIFATVICDRWSVITANTFRILQTALQPISVLWPTSCQYLHLCDRVPLLYPLPQNQGQLCHLFVQKSTRAEQLIDSYSTQDHPLPGETQLSTLQSRCPFSEIILNSVFCAISPSFPTGLSASPMLW